MVINRRDISIFVVVFILGTILGIIGTVSFPIESDMSVFWPAATIQAVGGILFGMWGVLAGTLFPSLSNFLTAGAPVHVIGLVPINFLQSYLPLLVKQTTNLKPYQFNRKTIILYIVGCVLLPNIISGILGCGVLYLFGNIATMTNYFETLAVWVIGNVPCAIVFGLLILKILVPVLKSCNLYYNGYFK